MGKWAEIRSNNYDNMRKCHTVDGWLTEDDNEEGKVIARVYDNHLVVYEDEEGKTDAEVQNHINVILSKLPYKKNTKITYMHRDEANFKSYGEIILKGCMTGELVGRVMSSLIDGEYFDPGEIGIGSLGPDGEWHELTGVEGTDETPDGMGVMEFVEKLEECARTMNGGTKYLQNLDMLIMVNSVYDKDGNCIPSEVSEMHIGKNEKGKEVLFITPSEISIPDENGAILVEANDENLSYEKFETEEEAKDEMKSRYEANKPEYEEGSGFEEMSYIGESEAVLYMDGDGTMSWLVIA